MELTVVYCTLCGTVIPYGSEAGGVLRSFGTSGLVYRSNKLMFDEETLSLWSSVEGRAAGRCTFRMVKDGRFAYEVLSLPAHAQDGISVLLLARAVARVRGSVQVLTAVDGAWNTAQLRTLGPERIRWRGREVATVHVESFGRYKGPAGLSGLVDVWVSDDERALPYRVKMKVAIGSVTIELIPDELTGAGGGVS